MIFMGVSFVSVEHRELAVSCIYLKISLQFFGGKELKPALKKADFNFPTFHY